MPYGLPHPEAKLGEVWIANLTDIDDVGWRTKRLGNIAYDINNRPITDHFLYRPVFVMRAELEAAGVPC